MPNESDAVLDSLSDSPVEEEPTALPQSDDNAEKEPDAPSPSEDAGTAGEDGEPSVDYKAELDRVKTEAEAERQRLVKEYDRQKSEARKLDAQLTKYREAERKQREEILADRDAWLEVVSDPAKFAEFMRGYNGDIIAQELALRDETLNRTSEELDAVKAGNELKDFATKDAGMSEGQYAAFLYKHSRPDPQTGQMIPFYGYPPAQALAMAKALIRDERFDHFAAKVKESADKEADAKAKRKLANALPSGVPAGGGKDGPESPEEAYRQGVRAIARGEDPRGWLRP